MDGQYLLGMDVCSSWPVIKLVHNLTAHALITHVRYMMFAECGKSHVIVTDNGRQFEENLKIFFVGTDSDFKDFPLAPGIEWGDSTNGTDLQKTPIQVPGW